MVVELNKNILKYLQKEGVGLESYILLLTIADKEDIFDENDVKIYVKCQELIIYGLLIELFGEEPELFAITEKGRVLLENIKKLTK